MILVSVFYPRSDKARFDHDYYKDQHFELITRAYGERLKHFAALQMHDDQLDGSLPMHEAAAHFMFATKNDFVEAFEQHREEIIADIQKFTDIDPVIEISDMKKTSVNINGN